MIYCRRFYGSASPFRVRVEQICSDPIGVGDLVPIGDAQAFDPLLQHLAGTGRFLRHPDRLHGGSVHREQRSQEDGADRSGNGRLN